MYNRDYTPERISELKENEIFVFGSNLAGSHGGGAARLAYSRFGAVWGQGVGMQGRSYAIPTMQGGTETIKPYVDEFVEYARQHPEYIFLVTRIGCGIAAFTPEKIAPLFKDAIDVENVVLPKDFVEILSKTQDSMRPSTVTCKAGNRIPGKTKVATRDSWKTAPMPESSVLIPMNVTISREAMQMVKYGHIPAAMEDHWFMYCDENNIRYYRSWTGFCIYIAKYVEEGEKCTITELQVNRDPEQYGGQDNDHDASLFMALLTKEYGGDAGKYWDKAFGK